MKKILLILFAILISNTGYSQSDLYLKINHKLGAVPFAMNASANNNIGNVFNVTRLEYYVSSISIMHDGGTVTNIPNVWILANASATTYELLGNFNIVSIEQVTFNVGVESPTNHNDPSLYTAGHPLAPKSPSMHWGWTAGYRFIAMEGMAGTTMPNQGYQLHGLGDVNYFSQTIPTNGTSDANGLVVELNADYISAVKNINVATGVISHGEVGEAKTMIENFRDFVFTSIEGNAPVGIEDKDNANYSFNIYPNPSYANQVISFSIESTNNSLNKTDLRIEILDITGKMIDSKDIVNTKNIAITSLEQGIYLVNLINDKRAILKSEKLIVTN